MNIISRIGISFIGSCAISIAGGSLTIAAAEKAGGCSSSCSVGAEGTGGENSDGSAQGFHTTFPSTRFADSQYSNSGSQTAGRISVTGDSDGSASGAFTPSGDLTGHFDGVIGDLYGVGDCNGVCN